MAMNNYNLLVLLVLFLSYLHYLCPHKTSGELENPFGLARLPWRGVSEMYPIQRLGILYYDNCVLY